MQTFTIGKNEAGQRFDKFLHKYLPEAPSSFIYKMLRKKNITLNKKKASGDEILSQGDTIESFFSDETFNKFHNINASSEMQDNLISDKFKDPAKSISTKNNNVPSEKDIIFEDNNFLLINKRAGILSQKSSDSDYSVNEWLVDYMLQKGEITPIQLKTFRPSICNRLDRNTEGIVICGKSLHGIQTLDALISEKKIEKHYLALCEGNFTHEGRISAVITKDSRTNKSKVSLKGNEGDPIITEFRIINKFENAALLDVNLLTGKSHQIRAQLSEFGNPIVGDAKYGGSTSLIKSQFLIAYKLIFPDGKYLPEDMKQYSGRTFEIKPSNRFSKVLDYFYKAPKKQSENL